MEKDTIYNLLRGKIVSKKELELFENELQQSVENTTPDLSLYEKILIISLLRKQEDHLHQIRRGIQFFFVITIIGLIIGLFSVIGMLMK